MEENELLKAATLVFPKTSSPAFFAMVTVKHWVC